MRQQANKNGLLRRGACHRAALRADPLAPRNDVKICVRDLAARSARVFPTTSRSLNSEGAGNAGRAMRPQPCVRNDKAHKHSHHGHTGITRHSPHNGFNGLLRALPGDRAFLPPSPARSSLTSLTSASGCQDHTTSPSAAGALRRCAPSASTASRSTSVTIAKRPYSGAGRGELVEMICPTGKAENFFAGDWTAKISLIRLNNSRFWRIRSDVKQTDRHPVTSIAFDAR